MSELARRLAPALPWALLAIVLLLIAVAAVLFVVLARARRRAAAPADAAPDADGTAAATREPLRIPAGAARSFARAVETLKRYVPGRDARYRIPWVAVMGPTGAGSSTVARSIDLPRPFNAPPEEPDARDGAVGWQFFEQGVVLDVPGGWVLDRAGKAHDEEGWRTFLRLLDRWRPDRPLDALVLTVPADALAGATAPGRAEVLARAGAVRERLWELQRKLGLRVPVHVLVTRCDRVPGFNAVCRELPERARQEVFGWSSPYPLEAAFAPQWVDEAFQSVHHDLYETQVELLAGCDPRNADGVFRFPTELRRLHPALKAYLGELFRDSAYREAFFFRGLYFTGDPQARDADGRVPASAPAALASSRPAAPDDSFDAADSADSEDADATRSFASADAGPADAADRRRDADGGVAVAERRTALAAAGGPLFLRHLFAERVFAESGLARASRGGARARGPWARAAQIAAALLLLIGVPGLLLAHRRLERTGEQTVQVLRSATVTAEVLDREAEGRPTAGTGRVGVVRMMDQLAALPTGRLWSPFIPQSWTGGLRADVLDAQAAAVGRAVLPALRARLMARADALLPADPAAGVGPVDPDSLAAYLGELGVLSDNVNRYNRLATQDSAGPADLEHLSAYLFGERVQARAGRASAWRRALRMAAAPRVRGDRTPVALRRTEAMTDEVYGRLSTTLATLEQDLENQVQADAGGWDAAGNPVVGAAPAGFDPGRLGSYFSGGDSAWLSPSAPLPARVQSALDSIPSSAVLDAPALRRDVRARFTAVRADQLSALESPADPQNAAAARSLVALRDALAALRGQPFADAGSPVRLMQTLPAEAPVAWDTVALSRALGRYDAYTAFVDGPQVAALQPRGQALVRSLAAAQLEAGMTRDVARAARALPAAGPAALASGVERELRARVGALAPASGMLARVAAAYSQAGRGAAYDDLGAFSATQAGAVLAQADRLLESMHYVPRDRGFGWWRGEPPVSFAAFGVRDTAGLDDYVAGQRASVGRLYTNFAAPVLALLQSDAFASFLAAPTPDAAGAAELAERWAALGDVLAKYEAKEPNSLSALESLILDDMGRAAPGNCAVGGGGRGSDWFATRARWLRDALLDRCRDLGAQWARQGYGQLRDAFNASLAGRFPFARDADGAQDADPAEVRAFLELYDRLAAVRGSVQSGRDGVGGAGSRAAAFLAQMDEAAAFLAPLVVADTGGGPAYRVAAEFRVDRAREVGADQVAEWSMQVGTARLVPRDSAATHGAPWSPGEPVTLAFRWAAGSPVRPSAAGLPWGGRTDGSTLWYGYRGDWSLLRLLAIRAANPRERLGTTLSLSARTVAAPLPARAAIPGDTVPADALLFVRVRVLDPATGRPLALPRFPLAAPALDHGDDS